MSEQVYMVWDFYDGIRSGIADYKGKPHYFECEFDNQIGDFSELFDLRQIDEETLRFAKEQWSIYRTWEFKFHSGKEQLENHPGGGNVSERYDQLERVMIDRVKTGEITVRARAKFTAKKDQISRPVGCLSDMEVDWL